MRPCPSVTTWCWHPPRPWLPSLVHSPCPAVWSLFSLRKVMAPLFLGNCKFSLPDSSLRPLTHPTTSVQLPEAKACPESWCQGSWTESRGGNGQRKKQRSGSLGPRACGFGEQLAVHKVHWHRGLQVAPPQFRGWVSISLSTGGGAETGHVPCGSSQVKRRDTGQERSSTRNSPRSASHQTPFQEQPPPQPSQNMATLMTEQPPIPCPGQQGYRFCRRVEI